MDESAITGESAPVVRESGGDFCSVTGGTTVVSDWLKIRITSDPVSYTHLDVYKRQGLEAVFTQTPTTHRKQCGKPFPTDGKRVYCSQRCAEEVRRKQTAARVRKYREKQQQM